MGALEGDRRDLCIGASLGGYTFTLSLPVVEKTSYKYNININTIFD